MDINQAMQNTTINGWKLFNLRKDGTIGPLFINRRQRIPSNQWLDAESHPTKGFAPRPQWHATSEKSAPHLSPKGRVWRRVQLQGVTPMNRPASQGGTWFLADKMRVLEDSTRGAIRGC